MSVRSRSRSYSGSLSGSPVSSIDDLPPIAERTVIVENLSQGVKDSHLREIFAEYGRINDIDLPRAQHAHKGLAYITYRSPADAEDALDHLNGGTIDGLVVSVSLESDTMLKTYSSSPYSSRSGSSPGATSIRDPTPRSRSPSPIKEPDSSNSKRLAPNSENTKADLSTAKQSPARDKGPGPARSPHPPPEEPTDSNPKNTKS